MKDILLFLNFFLLVSCVGNKKKPDCSRFKEGKFLIKEKFSRTHFIIERKNESQTELNENTDSISTFTVKWLSECEYEIVRISRTKKTITDSIKPNKVIEFKNAVPLKVKIISTDDKYCVFEARKDGMDFVYTDTMWIYK